MTRSFSLRLVLSASLALPFSTLHADETVEGSASTNTPSYSDTNGSAGGANTAMVTQLMGAGANAAAGASYSKICAQPHGGSWACPMAAMSYAQAASMLAAALMSGNTRNASTGGLNVPDVPKIPTIDIPGFPETPGLGPTTDDLGATISDGLGSLGTKGYVYDPTTGTMKTPNGEFNVDSNSTPASIAAAMGGSPSDMKMAESTAMTLGDQLAKQFDPSKITASVSGVEVDSGGGGGGGSRGPRDPNLADYFKGLRGPAAVDPKTLIAGKSRMLGGENIGIKVDNLFDMVHRRYQDKRRANTFLEPLISDGLPKK